MLELWWAEQGVSKPRDLQLIASALPFPRGQAVRVLDLCCGPGDVGRAIRHEYPNAQIDCVDRDPFLTAICAAVNRRDQVPGKIVVADLRAHGWQDGLARDYDAVVTANALHWFEVPRAEPRVLQELTNPGDSRPVINMLTQSPACLSVAEFVQHSIEDLVQLLHDTMDH